MAHHGSAEVRRLTATTDGENTFEKVSEADAAFRAATAVEVLDPAIEADALAAIFVPPLCTVCEATLGARWAGVVAKHTVVVAKLGKPELGAAIVAVVEGLDARHLLPSGIRSRLEDGVAPACYGLATLIDNLAK